MNECVPFQISCRFEGIFTLFAILRLLTRVCSHMDSDIASCCAKVVALCANKGLFSSVNAEVVFQSLTDGCQMLQESSSSSTNSWCRGIQR